MKPRKPLLKSFLALLLCISLLIGSTFAWFTDSVTSGGNIIKSGKLDVQMYWSDRLLSADSDEWQSADGVPVFDHSNWEPGYTQVRYVKISNEGNLALKWLLSIETEAQLGTIADVIDVYYINPVTSALTSLDGLTPVGVLKNVVAGHSSTSGALLPKDAQGGSTAILAIAFHMQESAGNDYMNQSTGAFTLKLLATQLQHESDSFDNTYDKEATWPNSIPTGSVSVPVTPAADGTVASDLTMANNAGTLSATVPAGAKLADGVSELTFSVSNMENGANISVAKGEEKWSLDVHVEGVAEDNDKPILISIAEALPKGLNLGNYTLYHVENGVPTAMTLVGDAAALVDHNQFTYDPATGNVTLSMKSFSEVALVAAESKWNGNYDYSWYTKDPTATAFTIANADQLAGLSAIVGGMAATESDRYGIKVAEADSFAGKTITLAADINIGDIHTDTVDASENGIVFYPIGYYNSEGTYEKSNKPITSGFKTFRGTFDGNGHTIKNFYQNTWEMKGDHDWYAATEQNYRDGMGLFGKVYGGTVKNLTVDNFSSDGEIATTGVIAAYADCGATFENIAIKNCNPRVYNIGNGGIVGCVGWYTNEACTDKVTFKNITVDNSNKISALWGSWDVACGGIVGQYYPTSGQGEGFKNGGLHFDNCHISAQIDVNNDVCANYQYYAYRYAGMIIGSIRENETVDGKSVPKMDGITASNCTVNYGIWNNYYYCELVANSLASYTHDHQMSRLTQVASVDTVNKIYKTLDGKTVQIGTGTYNLVVVTGNAHGTENAKCYHFVNGEVWNHADAGTETVNGVAGVLKEDKQHLYLPFSQLCTGYGWGVSSVGLNTYDGFENVTEGSKEASKTKFVANGVAEVQTGVAVSLGTLFKDVAYINDRGTWVSVVADDNNTNDIAYTFAPNITDWKNGTLAFTGTGTVYVTIQDYYYCKPTTIALNVVNTLTPPIMGTAVFSVPETKYATGSGTNSVTYQTTGTYPSEGAWQRRLEIYISDTSKEVLKFNFKITNFTGNAASGLRYFVNEANDSHQEHFVVTDINGNVVDSRALEVNKEYIFYGKTEGYLDGYVNADSPRGACSKMFIYPGALSGKNVDVTMMIYDVKLLDYEPEVGVAAPMHSYQCNAAPYLLDGNWQLHYRSFTGTEHHNNTAEYRRLELRTDGEYETVSFEFKFNTSQYAEGGATLTTLIGFAGLPTDKTFFYKLNGGLVTTGDMQEGQWYRAVIQNPGTRTTFYVMGHKNGDPNGSLDRNGDKIADGIISYVNIDMDFRNIKVASPAFIVARDVNDLIVTELDGGSYNMTTEGVHYAASNGTLKEGWQRTAMVYPPSNHKQVSMKFRFNSAFAEDGTTSISPTMTVLQGTTTKMNNMKIFDADTGALVDSSNQQNTLELNKWYILVIENPGKLTEYRLSPCYGGVPGDNMLGARVSVDITDLQVVF